jgi:uncharacterized small protein (DUF1192 family)
MSGKEFKELVAKIPDEAQVIYDEDGYGGQAVTELSVLSFAEAEKRCGVLNIEDNGKPVVLMG